MPEHTNRTNNVEIKEGGAWTTTFSLIASLLLIVAGVLLTIFLGGVYSYIFGVPLVIIGLLLIVVVQFVVAKKAD